MDLFDEKKRQSGQGDAGAQIYDNGEGTEQACLEAAKRYLMAAEQGNSDALNNLAYYIKYYTKRKGGAERYQAKSESGRLGKKVFKWFRNVAKRGNVKAQCILADWYFREHIAKEAVKWYRKAAEQGDAKAQNRVADCYYNGVGVKRSYEEATKWYLIAAQQGNTDALNNLAYYTELLAYVEKTEAGKRVYKNVFYWYLDAAKRGNAKAQYILAKGLSNWYDPSKYSSKGIKEEVEWYRRSAEQGYAEAQVSLGLCYERGRGVAVSYKEAIKWYSKAAAQGNCDAAYNLGKCYYNGLGVARSYDEALKWYRKAAAQGHVKALEALNKIAQT